MDNNLNNSFNDPSSLRLDSLTLPTIAHVNPVVTYSGKTLNDKRVKISMMPNPKSPQIFYKDSNNKLLNILNQTDGVVFPFQPKVDISYAANYDSQEVIHSNFAFKSYKNSELKAIDLTCNFPVRTPWEGQYVTAAIHFLRCLTMMFTGNDTNDIYNLAGSPPLIVSLSGMGFGGLDNIPVAVTNVTSSYPDNVDFLTVSLPSLDNELVKVPSQMTISVSLQPMFSRAYASAFGVKDFSYGTTRLLGPNPKFNTSESTSTDAPTDAPIDTSFGATDFPSSPNPTITSNNPTVTLAKPTGYTNRYGIKYGTNGKPIPGAQTTNSGTTMIFNSNGQQVDNYGKLIDFSQ